jgi:hypothetical protein
MFAELILISELLFNVPHTKATATPTATTTETPTTTTTAATYPVTIYEATGQELTNWWLDDERSFENIVIRIIVISYLIEKGFTSGII